MRVSCLAALATLLLACSSARTRQVDALMQSPIVPASDAIFNAVIYTNGQLAASPKTDEEWTRLQQHARSLVAASTQVKALSPMDDPDPWRTESDAMSEAASAVLKASSERSLEGVLAAGSRLFDTCTTCHARYVPEN